MLSVRSVICLVRIEVAEGSVAPGGGVLLRDQLSQQRLHRVDVRLAAAAVGLQQRVVGVLSRLHQRDRRVLGGALALDREEVALVGRRRRQPIGHVGRGRLEFLRDLLDRGRRLGELGLGLDEPGRVDRVGTEGGRVRREEDPRVGLERRGLHLRVDEGQGREDDHDDHDDHRAGLQDADQ